MRKITRYQEYSFERKKPIGIAGLESHQKSLLTSWPTPEDEILTINQQGMGNCSGISFFEKKPMGGLS